MVSAMQPLTVLQQLSSLTFTRCEYGTADALPITAMATLGSLVALDALDCGPFEPAGADLRNCFQQMHERRSQISNPPVFTANLPHLIKPSSCCAVQGL